MRHVKKAFLGAILLAGTALVLSSPARAQVVQFEGYVGTDPNYGADPNYVDPNYDPNYTQDYAQNYQDPNYAQGYQDPGYDPNYYDPGYDQQYSGDYNYDYSDPNYYYAPTYTPVYDPFYDPYCDYYTPPWGYPLDYCRYQTWNQPVYFGGLWYSGPIYYRQIGGVPWYWLNGGWRRDQWRGSRPSYIDWGHNHRWNGNRHNWRDEYRRGNWAGRDTWVGRTYRDNIREARSNVLDRARDRNFRQDFVRNIRSRDGNVAGGVRGRNGDRPGINNNGRGRDNGVDRRALRDGGSNLVRPNDRRPDVRGNNPRVDQQLDNRRNNLATPNQGPRFGTGPQQRQENRGARNEQRTQRRFAAPDRGPRVDNRSAQQRSFAAPDRGPRVDNPAFRNEQRAQRNFTAPNAGPRVDRGAQERSFAAPNRAPRAETRAPRAENRGFGGDRGAFAAPNSAPRVARPSGGQRFEARGNGGGNARAFSGGGGGNRSVGNTNRGGGAVTRGGGGGGNRGNRGRDR